VKTAKGKFGFFQLSPTHKEAFCKGYEDFKIKNGSFFSVEKEKF
jgi:hypothetical protein